MRCMGVAVEELDARLAALAREDAALRLRLGQALEVLGRGAVFELGFSSLAAYAVERCERSVRWAEGARCLARRVEGLPRLREKMAFGKVSWSMGELLARVATREDEASWVAQSESRTVRQMREPVARALRSLQQAGAAGRSVEAPELEEMAETRTGATRAGAEAAASEVASAAAEGGEAAGKVCTLTCTVGREEAWLFEATRSLLEQLGVRGWDEQMEALLAEGQGTLLGLLPEGTIEPDRLQGADAAQQRWVEQLARWRTQAEALCEQNVLERLSWGRAGGPCSRAGVGAVAVAAACGMEPLAQLSCLELDRHVRELSVAMARHELELSACVLRFHRADGWRRLGYASEAQYALERLGVSRSSLVARRTLALRLEKLRGVADALGKGQIGVEAALQLVRVATAETEAEWVSRAERRTIKHLREEVSAALVAVRWSGEASCPPPVNADMEAFFALEQAVVSGGFVCSAPADPEPACSEPIEDGPSVREAAPSAAGSRIAEPTSERRRAWFVMLGSLAAWLEGGLQTSAAPAATAHSRVGTSAGRVAIRLRMQGATAAWWRGLETQARRWLPPGVSWLRFLCVSLWQAWRHLLGATVAYGHIYTRDRHRCMSPVCNRRDLTPHHLQFRSAGGSDEDHNIGSLCTWCHLHGVHGGRIRARGRAELIRWELGPRGSPCVVVVGRERAA